ncbi:MAG: hypothetical protein KGJ60_05450 [Verrucomicrobiota bacterium]|nr:hypothetical protein [Verrucomicrobiota bacterium]
MVTIWATDPIASVSGDTGTFTVYRYGDTNLTLNVYYQVGGTASNGVDYAPISNWVTIPAGARINTITITPINLGQSNIQTVVLQLAPSPMANPVNFYSIGWPSNATVYIEGNGVTNIPPDVNIVHPTNGETFFGPTNIFLSASAFDPDGSYYSVTNVEFFAGTNDLGPGWELPIMSMPFIGYQPPYEFNWPGVLPGDYALTAVATDDGGDATTSAPVNITVLPGPPPTNLPPVVEMTSPTSGETFVTPTNIPLSAFADDSDGQITNLEFFAGTNDLGRGLFQVGPQGTFYWSLAWAYPRPGVYALTAVATDNGGVSTTSAPVDISVLSPSVVNIINPTDDQSFYAPTNIPIQVGGLDDWNRITNVEFFAGTNSLGFATPNYPTASFPGPYFASLVWSNPPVGLYALTSLATGYGGVSATSAPVNITVLQGPPPTNLPPLVIISTPTNGEAFTAPANFFILAPAYDPDGLVKTVAFFEDGNLLGIFTNPPPPPPGSEMPVILPQFYWTNVPAGNYVLAAVATDDGGASTTSAPVNISVQQGPPSVVRIISLTNGAVFYTPTNIFISALVPDQFPATNVEFFAGTNSLGFGTQPPLALPPFGNYQLYFLVWSNAPAGAYELTAVAEGVSGSITSAPVNITVLQGPPPTNLPPLVSIFIPTNGAVFFVPTNANVSTSIELLAKASDPDGAVIDVEFFAGTNDLGPASPVVLDPPGVNGVTGLVYFIYWRNPSTGNYALTAVATDDGGASTTSAAVNVTIQPGPSPVTNLPPVVRIISPPNGAVFRAPINLPLFAYAYDPGASRTAVGFYDGTNFLGLGNPISTPLPLSASGTMLDPIPVPPTALSTNIYFLVWSNAPVGNHVLTADAVFGFNNISLVLRVVSDPVNVTILPPLPPPTNRPPVVSIVASDPVAIEGTNSWTWRGETNTTPTWADWRMGGWRWFTNSGPKTATFTVRRFGETNDALAVTYDIGGTASNDVDYAALPGFVTIPAGQRRALIPIVPIDDGPPDVNKTVILTLAPSTNSPPDYLLGYRRRAAALILDSACPWPDTGLLPGRYFHLHASGPDATWFCIEVSTNLADWTPLCTNQVIHGSIDFLDPDVQDNAARFYRAIPLSNPPSE